MYETELAQHITQQDQVDEFMFCIVCGEKVYLHDRDTYETCQDGVVCKQCAALQAIAEEFNKRVAAGVDPIEAARDADACCCSSFQEWQKCFQDA